MRGFFVIYVLRLLIYNTHTEGRNLFIKTRLTEWRSHIIVMSLTLTKVFEFKTYNVAILATICAIEIYIQHTFAKLHADAIIFLTIHILRLQEFRRFKLTQFCFECFATAFQSSIILPNQGIFAVILHDFDILSTRECRHGHCFNLSNHFSPLCLRCEIRGLFCIFGICFYVILHSLLGGFVNTFPVYSRLYIIATKHL